MLTPEEIVTLLFSVVIAYSLGWLGLYIFTRRNKDK